MHEDGQNLDLSFPTIPVGEKETPLNLIRLLYKGGASTRIDKAEKAIREGLLGEVIFDRIPFIQLSHTYISDNLAAGGSVQTARVQIRELTEFFNWADRHSAELTVSGIINSYLEWSNHLLHRCKVAKNINQQTIYSRARMVGQIIDKALERTKPILRATRIKRPNPRKTPRGAKADKQNLDETFKFGRLIQDICDGLPLEVIWKEHHIRIQLQQGGELEYRFSNRTLTTEKRRSDVNKANLALAAYKTNQSLDHRFRRDMVNLRMQAELLMFMAQTGMNLTQAQNIPLYRFSYSSDIDGYKVREYKPRRKGEVLFEIFNEYRSHFERYLEWRRKIFPETEKRIFPFIRVHGAHESGRLHFGALKSACKSSGIKWITPSALRSTRINWLLRRSGDPDITAEMAQHHEKTLLTVYEIPSQQRAISEIVRFHVSNDPALVDKAILLAAAPGACDGIPTTSSEKPISAPEPDCRSPSGCLWCDHHRDIDTLDYVWSLASFRHLKIIEVGKEPLKKGKGQSMSPAEHSVVRLTEKLKFFRESKSIRRDWVDESLMRIEEGYYHDQWSYIIESMEGVLK